jgi:hypothetical protein
MTSVTGASRPAATSATVFAEIAIRRPWRILFEVVS